MTDLSNLTGLEKPLVKLIETIGEGLGVVGNDLFKFDAKQIKRIGEAEAEAEKVKIIKKAEGEAQAVEILKRGMKRFAIEQYNKQINLENIIVKSKDYLGDKVSDEPVTKDWSARFISVAQEVSREEIQELLAKILAKEVTNPDSYSLRTLEIIRNLNRDELEEFKKFIALSSINGYFHINGANREPLAKYGLNFGVFVHLADIGLFNPSENLSIELEIKTSRPSIFNVAATNFLITSEVDKKFNLGILKFTEAGMQIFDLLKNESSSPKRKDYIKDFENNITKNGFKAEKVK